MMKNMKKFLTILLVASVAFLNVRCDDYLDVNKNVDTPDHVEAYLYLAGIEGYYMGYYYDLRGLAPLCQYFGSSSSYAYNYGYYQTFNVGSDYMGEVWKMTYWTQGRNLENLINQAVADEQWTLAGIGYAIKANSWDMLTKEYGEAPMKQAFESGRLSFDYDYQDSIMPQVRKWAYQAIEYLTKGDNTNYGTHLKDYDVIYGGDASKWTKFAYGVIVRDLSAMSHKTDFVSGGYAQELVECAAKSLTSDDDDACVTVPGGAEETTSSYYNNFWGVYRSNLGTSFWQHDYIAQLLTGTVREYDEANGQRIPIGGAFMYKPEDVQYITDTLRIAGNYDPRLAAMLATRDDATHENMDDADAIMKRAYYGGGFTGSTGPVGVSPSLYGLSTGTTVNVTNSGTGRWLFRDNAPYILMTASEIQFCAAEAYWMMGDKANALSRFKNAVSLDMDFTVKFLVPGTKGTADGGGDKITKATFTSLANSYLAGPYVGGLTASTLTLSHIMLQKYVALWPWGALETWTDLRKCMFDIEYSGEYPSNGNGWTNTTLNQKWDSNPSKIYKGFFLPSAQVDGRYGSFSIKNEGSPAFRIRPRYNSEYMWNLAALQGLKPIAGDDDRYSCSIPWFAYPGDMPETL